MDEGVHERRRERVRQPERLRVRAGGAFLGTEENVPDLVADSLGLLEGRGVATVNWPEGDAASAQSDARLIAQKTRKFDPKDYEDRYAAYDNPEVTDNPGGFNFKQFQSNMVFRWEYRPGSTLFVVWNQGRQGSARAAGPRASATR